MKALAPGKVVLSGAYSVLEGAPAIVAAVDRYVIADATRTYDFLTDEVRAAGILEPCWFDANRLREADRKLGLGSSAAILLACLASRELVQHPTLDDATLRQRIFEGALVAHRTAQGGGSGIDVAASCHGGILEFQLGPGLPSSSPIALPPTLTVEVWASDVESKTSGLISQVRTLRTRAPQVYRRLIDAQTAASEQAVRACRNADAPGFVAALTAQREALHQLGEAARAPIVTREVAILAEAAARHGAVVLPAGAGGGDIALFVGFAPARELDHTLAQQRHHRLDLHLGAEGVHRAPDEW